MLESIDDDDLICIRWTQPTILEHALYIAPTTKRLFDLEIAWAKFERCLASKQGFELDAAFSLSVFSLKRRPDHGTFPTMSGAHVLETTAGGDPPSSSSYLRLNAGQRPQLATLDFRPLQYRASELINRCKSIVDVRDDLFSPRLMRVERMQRSYRQKLYSACEQEARARSHKKPRIRAHKGSPFDADLVQYLPVRHVLKYSGKDCVPRSLAVGVAHAVVFARAQQLLECLENAVKIDNTANLLAAIKEAEIFGSVLPKNKLSMLSCGAGSQPFESFMADAAKNFQLVAKQVYNTILRSEAFDLAYQSLVRYNPPGGEGDRYVVKQLNALAFAIQKKMQRALDKGYSKIDLKQPWPFVVPGMSAKNVRVSIYTFDGIRIDGLSREVSPYSDVHVRVLQSWAHMWVLTGGIEQLRGKCPSSEKLCDMCNARVSNKSSIPHACPLACKMCRRVCCDGRHIRLGHLSDAPLVQCSDCHRLFLKGSCYSAHKKRIDVSSPKSLCDVLQLCETCSRLLDKNDTSHPHVCGQMTCSICGVKYRRFNVHKCFLQRVERSMSPLLRKSIPLAFDCETVVDKTTGIMLPILVVVGEYDGSECRIVAEFTGYDCFTKMAAWMMSSVENRILIAHNGARFDTMFLADALFRLGVETELIRVGSGAILQLQITSISVRIVDSCRLSPSSLNQFFNAYVPKDVRQTLNLAGKEFFPYALLTKTNYDAHYIAQPTLSDYQPGEKMGDAEHARLIATVRVRRDSDGDSPTYNLHEELLSYCRSDVRLLAMGVHYFREACLTFAFNTDPLTEATTVASLAMRVWRKQFLPSKTVALFTEGRGKPSSYVADQYLNWIKSTEAPDLQFTFECGTEKKVYSRGKQWSPRWLDGYSAAHKRAYEFLGCFWHGCPICYRNNRDIVVPALGMSFSAAYEAVGARQYTIMRDNSSTVKDFTIMWQHQWNEAVENPANAAMATFIKNYEADYPPPLVERDALFGG